MPKRKIERSFEEQEKFQRQRRERNAQNQYNRRQNAKKTIDKNNLVISEIFDTTCIASTSSVDQVVCIASTSSVNQRITCAEYQSQEKFQRQRRERNAQNQYNRRQIAKKTIDKNNLVISEISDTTCIASTSSVDQIVCIASTSSVNQRITCAEYQSHYRSRKKGQSHLNINNTVLINNLVEYYIGPMDVSCIHCHAKHFAAERVINKGNSFHDCCNHGSVCIDPLPESPNVLRTLFAGNHVKSNNFFKHIRGYNNSFSFASFQTNLVNFQNRKPGPYCFKIQGHIYYQINTTLYAAQNENPTYGQLFIVDSNEAIDCRVNANSNLDLEIIQNLEHIMRECNIFAQSYQMMGELKN